MRLDFIRLLTKDFDECYRFYRDVMGFKVSWGEEGETYASFDTGDGTSLSLFSRSIMSETLGTVNLPEDRTAQDSFVIIVGVTDLDGTVREMRTRGANFLTGPQDYPNWGIRVAYLRDPDGNLIELNCPISKDRWSEDLLEEQKKYSK